MACFCLVQKNWNLYARNKLHAIPYFPAVFRRMRGRARFQVTTMDSVFAIKVWMFELKDCELETTKCQIARSQWMIGCLENSWNRNVMNRIMKLDDRMSL